MLKSEYAEQNVRKALAREGGPVNIEYGLIDRAWLLTDDGDPRWIVVALDRLLAAGEIVYPGCDHNHNHNSTCTVQLVASCPK